MDFDEFLFPPDYLEIILKEDIYLDDAPIISIIYNTKSQGNPTPADIVSLWSKGGSLTESLKKTLVEILVNKIQIVYDLKKELEAIALLETELPKTNSNPNDSIMIWIALWRLYQETDPTKGISYYTKAKKLMNQYRDQVDLQTWNKWSNLSNDGNREADPYQLRSEAMDKLEKHDYEEAERIYLQMIKMDFELPGTLCHLARAQLLRQDENAARKSINRAWKIRDKAPNYVLPRILFFKIMLTMLENKNPAKWIYELKSALKDESCFMVWTIKPTVNHYQSRLPDDDLSILMILAEVLQDFQNKHLFDESIELK